MKKLISIIVLALPLIVGCDTFPKKNSPNVITEQTVKVDPKLLQPCEELKVSQSKDPNEILIEDIEIIKLYGVCRNKQADSIKAIKQLANIKE